MHRYEASGWFRFLSTKGATLLTDLDCKKHFDNIHPWAVLQSFTEASGWLYKKWHWRQVNLQWSISKDTPQ